MINWPYLASLLRNRLNQIIVIFGHLILYSDVFSLQNSQCFLWEQVTSVLDWSCWNWNGYIEVTKGERKLSKNGSLYIKNKTLTNGRTYCECSQRQNGNGCNVKITLMWYDMIWYDMITLFSVGKNNGNLDFHN